MSVTITTKSGQVYKTEESFATIQRAMTNKTLLELKVGDRKIMINPETIESIDAPQVETNTLYKLNAGKASNFPFQMTPEETKEMQNKLQPLKAMFDAKAEAMREMKAKEDATVNNSYANKYAGYMEPAESVIVTETSIGLVNNVAKTTIELPFSPESLQASPVVGKQASLDDEVKAGVIVKKAGRPKKSTE